MRCKNRKMLKNCQTAIILAGGESKRMGFDKFNIPYKEKRMIDYQVNQFKKKFSEIIIVSHKLSEYPDDRIKIVTDEYKGIGPLAGLHVGLKHATHPYSYVIACDMPFIDLEFIEVMDRLIKRSRIEILLSEVDGYLEPFNAMYKKSLYKKIETFVLSSQYYGLQDFIKKTKYKMINPKIVQLFDKSMYNNLNTMDDVKKYLKIEVDTNG